MQTQDIPEFFAKTDSLNLDDYVLFDYLFETDADPKLVAAQMCSEQSTAQWKRVELDEDLRGKFGAKVLSLEIISENKHSPRFQCKLRIAHPHINFGPRIPNILSALAGEGAFYCPGIRTVRIVDIHFPKSFLKNFQGPQFGLKGLREILQIENRPFFLGVVKPNIGLNPKDFSQLAFESWMGGLDIAKDDEMLADTNYSPLSERARLCSIEKQKVEKTTNTPKMFLANITDEVDVLPTLYKSVSDLGSAIMINGFFTGMSSLRAIRKISTVPLFGHFTGQALFDRIPHFGIDSVVFVKLQRLAGCDGIIMPGFGERMFMKDDAVLKNIKACLTPMGDIKPSLPIPGGSDWAGTLAPTFNKIGHSDFGFICGRGVFGHPQGPRAGAMSLHQAWEAIVKGITLEEQGNRNKELGAAIKMFT